ncbi:MAG TPA: heme ABC transporter ATP-binding protein [Burkholderiaceae bacterium]|nr:heme ABC transporter ATP-binding protein [Burkholderiaceae bacterium]HRZ02119.1 heme ABC transporter ATP-binding protein [Burkholderiaceae bacterium]HRZ59914.1 heme ABC transporter ATP-binding protein [Rubrivivax sp.]
MAIDAGVEPSLALEHVSVFRGRRALVQSASLQAGRGEFIALVGPNGAGKSSLLRAVTGEWTSSGQVRLFGRARADWPVRELARRLAVMPQSSSLVFAFTVSELIAMGRLPHAGCGRRHDRDVVEEVVERLGLQALRNRSYTTLSGGERQRAQFGRVLAQIWEAPGDALLLLDEPTSALDLAQQLSLLSIARERAEAGTCVIAVMHDLNLAARFATRVVAMAGGRVLHDGTCRALYSPTILAEVFGVVAEVEHAACDGTPIVIARTLDKRRRGP